MLKETADGKPSEIIPPKSDMERRKFLKTSAVWVAAWAMLPGEKEMPY